MKFNYFFNYCRFKQHTDVFYLTFKYKLFIYGAICQTKPKVINSCYVKNGCKLYPEIPTEVGFLTS